MVRTSKAPLSALKIRLQKEVKETTPAPAPVSEPVVEVTPAAPVEKFLLKPNLLNSQANFNKL